MGSPSDHSGANLAGVPETDFESDAYTAAIAAELKAERAATGVQNEVIAQAANMSARQVIRLFNGERAVSLKDAFLISQALNLSMNEFVKRVEARVEKQRQG